MPDPGLTPAKPAATGAGQSMSTQVGAMPPSRVAVDDVLLASRAANGRRPAGRRRAPVVRLELRLPRHAESVGLTRRILDSILQAMTIDQHCRDELLLALGEGCANVVQHAVGADGYEVHIGFDDACCVVNIIDNGRHALQLPTNPSMPDLTEECGRGLSIMALSTDSLQISPRQPHGLAVRFTKRLL
jgi:serine/threonine-protein kinase RsbW